MQYITHDLFHHSRRPSSERKSKKVEPEKKAETTPAPLKKTEEKQAAKTKEEKTILKVGHATERKPTQPPTSENLLFEPPGFVTYQFILISCWQCCRAKLKDLK